MYLTRALVAAAEVRGRACQGRFVVVVECSNSEKAAGKTAGKEEEEEEAGAEKEGGAETDEEAATDEEGTEHNAGGAVAVDSLTSVLTIVQALRTSVASSASAAVRPARLLERIDSKLHFRGSDSIIERRGAGAVYCPPPTARPVRRHILRVPPGARSGDTLRFVVPTNNAAAAPVEQGRNVKTQTLFCECPPEAEVDPSGVIVVHSFAADNEPPAFGAPRAPTTFGDCALGVDVGIRGGEALIFATGDPHGLVAGPLRTIPPDVVPLFHFVRILLTI